MNKELQNLAWSVLPKEFKEKVRKEYKHRIFFDEEQRYWMLEEIFGKHNLTFNTKEEEILYVSRKQVQEFYDKCFEQLGNCSEYDEDFYKGAIYALQYLKLIKI